MDKKRGGQQRKNVAARDFAYLNEKSPVELIEEMEALIDSMDEEAFDTELIDAYSAALQQKAPVMEDFDPEVSWAAFLDRHQELIANLEQEEPEPKKEKKARRLRPRLAYVAAIVCFVLFGGTVTANAYDVNVVERFILWGREAFLIGPGEGLPSGNLELSEPDVSGYTSMADALQENGFRADVCPTWIPEQFNLVSVEADIEEEEQIFRADYQDSEANNLVFTIYYTEEEATGYAIEKDLGSGERYVYNGVEYTLDTNMGHTLALWQDNQGVYLLSGAVSTDEMKYMLHSIKKEEKE